MNSFCLKQITILLLTLHVLTVFGDFNATETCALITNGTRIKDPTACNKWIECVNLKPIEYTCADGLFYDRNAEKCVPANTIECISSDPCATLTNGTTSGFVPDPYSCSKYYYCSSGSAAQGSCKTDWTYNATTKTCILAQNCALPIDPDSFCNIVPDGVFIGVPGSCVDYQECWQSVLLNNSCPDTFFFDAFNGVCNDNITVCPTTNVATQAAIIGQCEEAGQFIPDNSTCNGYYYCEQTDSDGFTLVHGNCSTGYFFEETESGECVLRTNVVCPYDRCAGLGLQKIQLSNLADDGCKGYAVCQYGKEIGSGQCPDEQYFDEVQQLCVTDVVSYAACASSKTSTAAISTSTASSTTTTISTTTISTSTTKKP